VVKDLLRNLLNNIAYKWPDRSQALEDLLLQKRHIGGIRANLSIQAQSLFQLKKTIQKTPLRFYWISST